MLRPSAIPICGHGAAKEVEADGNTVVLNGKAAVASVKFMTAFWNEAHDEGGLAWRRHHQQPRFAIGHDQRHAQWRFHLPAGEDQARTPISPKGTPLWQDILHAPLPKGPTGAVLAYHLPMSNMLMGYSKNQKAAREFIRWITSKDVYQNGSTRSKAIPSAPRQSGKRDPLWGKDPVMEPFRIATRALANSGYAGPADRKAAEVLSKYIITDMYIKAVQGSIAGGGRREMGARRGRQQFISWDAGRAPAPTVCASTTTGGAGRLRSRLVAGGAFRDRTLKADPSRCTASAGPELRFGPCWLGFTSLADLAPWIAAQTRGRRRGHLQMADAQSASASQMALMVATNDRKRCLASPTPLTPKRVCCRGHGAGLRLHARKCSARGASDSP